MKFEITEEYLDKLSSAIDSNDIKWLEKQLKKLHPADIASLLNELNPEEGKKLYNFLEDKIAANALIEMEEDKREILLSSLTSEQIADRIDHLPSDEATDVITELPHNIRREVLQELEKDDALQASDIVELLKHREGTAGALMQKEMVTVFIHQSLLDCVRQLRKHAEHIEDIYAVYVVNNEFKFQGLIPIKKILTNSLRSRVAEVMEQQVITVTARTDGEEVAKLMKKYDLVVVPVLDELGKLLGRITIDDVVDVIHEEAEKDIQMMSGITENVEHNDKVWVLSRARIPWLFVGLIGGIVGAQVISRYEEQIQIHPEMAFFIPLIAAMGGNAGVQSSAIMVQGIAEGAAFKDSILKKLLKEFSVGIINALIFSALILLYNLYFSESNALTASVSTALFGVIVFATLFGTFVPLILHKYKIDPALATGPFITTTNDVLGLILYLIIGRIMYGSIP